jgi:hypothetical protein
MKITIAASSLLKNFRFLVVSRSTVLRVSTTSNATQNRIVIQTMPHPCNSETYNHKPIILSTLCTNSHFLLLVQREFGGTVQIAGSKQMACFLERHDLFVHSWPKPPLRMTYFKTMRVKRFLSLNYVGMRCILIVLLRLLSRTVPLHSKMVQPSQKSPTGRRQSRRACQYH